MLSDDYKNWGFLTISKYIMDLPIYDEGPDFFPNEGHYEDLGTFMRRRKNDRVSIMVIYEDMLFRGRGDNVSHDWCCRKIEKLLEYPIRTFSSVVILKDLVFLYNDYGKLRVGVFCFRLRALEPFSSELAPFISQFL